MSWGMVLELFILSLLFLWFYKVLSLVALSLSHLVTLLPSRPIALFLPGSQFSIGYIRFSATPSFPEKAGVAKRRIACFCLVPA